MENMINKKLSQMIITAALALTSVSCASQGPITDMKNPLIDQPGMSDPHAIVEGEYVYIFTGHDVGVDQPMWVMPNWRIFRSKDFKSWEHVGTIDPKDNFMGEGHTSCWAGDVVKKNGKFYWYFSNHNINTGVMVANQIEGPYKDALGKPIIDSFDPSIFVEDDGSCYIIVGHHSEYKIARLKDSMIELAETPKDIIIDRTDAPVDFPRMDKNAIHKYNGTYYLSCSGYYATSDNLYGPYKVRGVVGADYELDTPYGHGEFFEFKGHWYHVWCKYLDRKHDRIRECHIAPVIYEADGTMRTDLSVIKGK